MLVLKPEHRNLFSFTASLIARHSFTSLHVESGLYSFMAATMETVEYRKSKADRLFGLNATLDTGHSFILQQQTGFFLLSDDHSTNRFQQFFALEWFAKIGAS